MPKNVTPEQAAWRRRRLLSDVREGSFERDVCGHANRLRVAAFDPAPLRAGGRLTLVNYIDTAH